MFIYKDLVKIPDVDQNTNLTERGLIRILQEAANLASSSYGYGLEHMKENKSTWILLNWRVKFLEQVKYNSEITVKTWAFFQRGLYSIRNFEIYVEDKLVAIADSKWVFVDYESHAIKKITPELMELYGNEEQKVFEDDYNPRYKLTETAKEIFTYTTMARDLDQNHHVNNIAYVDIAKEVLPKELKTKSLSELAVIYKKELKYQDKVTCFYEIVDGLHIVYMYNKDTDTLNAIVTFKE